MIFFIKVVHRQLRFALWVMMLFSRVVPSQ